MCVIRGMAGYTFLGRTLINTILMTSRTWYPRVRTSESKTGHLAVVKVDILPGAWVVTGTAVITELSIVSIV